MLSNEVYIFLALEFLVRWFVACKPSISSSNPIAVALSSYAIVTLAVSRVFGSRVCLPMPLSAYVLIEVSNHTLADAQIDSTI